MVLDTVIGVFLAGLGLWWVQQKRRRPVRFVSVCVLLLGVTNCLFRMPGVSLHGRIFLPGSPIYLPDHDSHMARGAALEFVLVAVGLLLLARMNRSVGSLRAVAFLGLIITCFALIALLAFATDLKSAPWWEDFLVRMAIPTAVSFSLLGIGFVALFWQESAESPQHLSITAAVLAVLGLLLLFGGVDSAVWASSNSILSTRLEIRRTSDEIRVIERLVEAVRKAETGQRGYLLTGDTQYLREFREGRKTFGGLYYADFIDKDLVNTSLSKFEELQRTVTLEATGRHEEALKVVRSSTGIRLMERIEALAANSESHMRQRLAQKLEASRQSVFLVRKTILISYGAAVLFAGVALLLVGSEIRRRSRIELTLREKEASLAETNRDLQQQTAKAQEASNAKSSFLASMSHEIRTPMNAILGMADMLWESDLADTQRHYVEVFRRAGGNLLTLINDILDLSKIESGNFALEQIDFDLCETIEQVTEILGPKAQAKGLALLDHIDACIMTSVIGDSARLQQILMNLVGNAIKFTEQGEVVLRVRTCFSAAHATFKFEVSDTGIGIPADKLAAIFEDFTQAESSTTRRYGGTGLGLGISRRLVGLMGGELQVRSEVGTGSTFFFDIVLPLGRELRSITSSSLGEVIGKSVIVVDNNATNKVILGEMCSAWGMEVTTCDSGQEATDIAGARENRPFTLALVDRLMPGMDGFETALRLQELCPEIKILIVSSDNRAGDVSRCRQLGFAGHIMKPVRRTELLQQIMKALSTSEEQPPIISNTGELLQPRGVQGAAKIRHILVAEDSEDNRFLLQAYCKGSAFQPTFVVNGEEALLAYQRGAYDLIAMDVQMPIMDGLTATRRIRVEEQARDKPHIPILALTANALPRDVEEALEAGCDAHLAKPISKHRFLRALEEWAETSNIAAPSETANASVFIDIPEGLEELAPRYLGARRQELDVLEAAVQRADFEQLRTLAHNMKGSGTSYGFPEVTRIGKAMEQASKECDVARLSKQLLELSTYVEAASRQLSSIA